MRFLTKRSNKKALKQISRWKNYPTHIISVILSIALIATITLSSIEIYANHNIAGINSRRDAVRNQLIVANNLLTSVQSADISQRDYILTNNSRYLQNQQELDSQINLDIRELKTPTYVSNVDRDKSELISLTKGKEKQLSNTLAIYRQSGTAAAVATFSRSEYSTSRIEALVKDIQAAQQGILNNYQNEASLYQHLVSVALPFLIIFDAVIFILTIYIFRSGINKERRLEREQSEFISIASHQLRTPATTVKQYVAMLKDGFFGNVSAKQKAILDTIEGANNRSISIANNLLYTSQIDSGLAVIKKEPCDLKEVIKKTLENYNSTIKNSRLSLRKILPDKPAIIKGDENYLQIVFETVIDNACRYSSPGKSITVSLKANTQSYSLRIKDAGVGIKPAEQKQLFKKFSRLERGVKMYPDGSGVGLYLMRSIMAKTDGHYFIKSELNKGTTFEFIFPKLKPISGSATVPNPKHAYRVDTPKTS
jgi:signal transduction histidine kinase